MTSIGSKYNFGRRKPLTAFQRFEAWRNFRRSQLKRVQQFNQSFSTAYWQSYQRKVEDSSVVAAQAALARIRSEFQAKHSSNIGSQLARLLDKKV